MSDRDRLAADLHAERVGCAYALPRKGTPEMALCIKNGTHIAQADRLIALGWTRPSGDPIGICALPCGHDGPHDTKPTLDEERLARALERHYPVTYEEGDAAAIAKAYREDEG